MLRYLAVVLTCIVLTASPGASAQAVEPRTSATVGTLAEWMFESDAPHVVSVSQQDIVVRLERLANRKGITGVRLAIARGKAKPSTFTYDLTDNLGTMRLAEFDRSNDSPEVVISFYSGGAHCCYTLKVFRHDGKAWKDVPFTGSRRLSGTGDGDGDMIQDFNKDGIADIVERNDSFLYLYTSYADSFSPRHYFNLRGGKWVEVSTSPGFRELYAYSDAEMREFCGDGTNGFWAAHVAEQAMLGNFADAWAQMQKCHDRKTDWGLCKSRDEFMGCKKGKYTFPEALEQHLKAQGYWPKR